MQDTQNDHKSFERQLASFRPRKLRGIVLEETLPARNTETGSKYPWSTNRRSQRPALLRYGIVALISFALGAGTMHFLSIQNENGDSPSGRSTSMPPHVSFLDEQAIASLRRPTDLLLAQKSLKHSKTDEKSKNVLAEWEARQRLQLRMAVPR